MLVQLLISPEQSKSSISLTQQISVIHSSPPAPTVCAECLEGTREFLVPQMPFMGSSTVIFHLVDG